MPSLLQQHITRDDVRNNRDRVYVFGDNHQRTGYGGQAAAMRGEPNAIGVATKWQPHMWPTAFFSDDDYDTAVNIINNDLNVVEQHLKLGIVVVWPAAGIGSGLSQMETKCPRVFNAMRHRIKELYRKYGLLHGNSPK